MYTTILISLLVSSNPSLPLSSYKYQGLQRWWDQVDHHCGLQIWMGRDIKTIWVDISVIHSPHTQCESIHLMYMRRTINLPDWWSTECLQAFFKGAEDFRKLLLYYSIKQFSIQPHPTYLKFSQSLLIRHCTHPFLTLTCPECSAAVVIWGHNIPGSRSNSRGLLLVTLSNGGASLQLRF